MIVLGIESATVEIGVGLYDDSGPRASFSVIGTRRHVETLHPLIDYLRQACGIELSEIGAIAVDVGPGRFTGIRVGMAGAQSLGMALDIPVIGIKSTDALIRASDRDELVIPVIDMRRAEIAFQLEADLGPILGSTADLIDSIKSLDVAAVHLVGDGALRYREEIEQNLTQTRVSFGTERDRAPSALLIAGLGWLEKENLAQHNGPLKATYLRAADVRVSYITRDSLVSQALPEVLSPKADD